MQNNLTGKTNIEDTQSSKLKNLRAAWEMESNRIWDRTHEDTRSKILNECGGEYELAKDELTMINVDKRPKPKKDASAMKTKQKGKVKNNRG